MSPDDAVTRLAEIVAARDEFSDEEIYDAMEAAGIPGPVADRAYKFTQTAWARALLDGLGVRFSPDYLCFNASGDVIETGRFADEPHYRAASGLVPRYAGSPGFRRLAFMSADVHTINNALNAGSRPGNLVTAPGFIFLEAPTPAGLEHANRVIAGHMAALRHLNPPPPKPLPARTPDRTPPAAKKPWWRPWA